MFETTTTSWKENENRLLGKEEKGKDEKIVNQCVLFSKNFDFVSTNDMINKNFLKGIEDMFVVLYKLRRFLEY